MPILNEHIPELYSMKKYPEKLFYSGNLELLKKRKISIVGSRKPTKYSRLAITNLTSTLSKTGFCIVSGGAMGIDATAHASATPSNTIAVLPCSIDIKYPAVNKKLLHDIEQKGLLISQFDEGFSAKPWSFVVRNELVVALGDILIVAEADLNSGTMRSVEFALKMKKDIYVLPHRIGESKATNQLLQNSLAIAIYDIDDFISTISDNNTCDSNIDEFVTFCKNNPSYDATLRKFPSRTFEAELNGEIEVINGKVILL